MTKQEGIDCGSNDRYETIATRNVENVFWDQDEGIKDKNEPSKDTALQTNSFHNVSDAGQSVLNSISQSTSMHLNTSDLATSIASDLATSIASDLTNYIDSDLEGPESASLQASMEAILVATATPEIHSQYELATIEEQPELGYQSDSSDTESLMMPSTARSKIITSGNGGVSHNVKRKSLAGSSTIAECSGTTSSEPKTKVLAPVLEDMTEGNDN